MKDINKLTSQRVDELYTTCLSQSEENTAVTIKGIILSATFSVANLNAVKEDIVELIMQLPEGAFKGSKDNGLSFLTLCHDKDEEQWTSFHACVERLMMLAMCIQRCVFLMPRNMWKVLPGGLPYLLFNTEDFTSNEMCACSDLENELSK